MASIIRVERRANCSRKSGRWRDCAASTASSINSSACLDVVGDESTLPRRVVECRDSLALILRIDRGEAPRVANWEALLLSNPTGESQCESIAGPHRVAKSPIAVVLSNLFPSQPETSAWHHQAV